MSAAKAKQSKLKVQKKAIKAKKTVKSERKPAPKAARAKAAKTRKISVKPKTPPQKSTKRPVDVTVAKGKSLPPKALVDPKVQSGQSRSPVHGTPPPKPPNDETVQGDEPVVNPYGASDEAVEEASEALGVVFPKMAIRVWKAINGGEINDWKFHPLRDPVSASNPKGDIVSINADHRPEDLPDEMISIAEQDGNHLVLEKEDDRLLPDLLLWDHDSGEVDVYSEDLANFAEEAEELRDDLLYSRRR